MNDLVTKLQYSTTITELGRKMRSGHFSVLKRTFFEHAREPDLLHLPKADTHVYWAWVSLASHNDSSANL